MKKLTSIEYLHLSMSEQAKYRARLEGFTAAKNGATRPPLRADVWEGSAWHSWVIEGFNACMNGNLN